ncbi:phosphotransferase [Tianweitania sp. BSSL-BM11]|uniref:Hydroxylysine kinase n=1 Tax=Tianweitania aestuarii TaxID=2814886 RepID=A0ABS5RRC1_9HYPH|nr:phosphotransferase [Tianweitania aestuarii]MBS9719603.1 phosphotransferase [Tianweitania aestuarii]
MRSEMTMGASGLGAELNTGATAVPADQAEQIARDIYGLEGTAEWLWGEKDSNYRLTFPDGTATLLKILNPAEDPEVTNMHSLALLHVEAQDPGIPLQRIIRTKDGGPDARIIADDGGTRGVRMVSFVPGTAQRTAPHSPLQRRRIGALLGRMQKALKSFHHPAASHRITWDMTHAADLRALLSAFPDAEQRARLQQAFDRFDADIVPVMADLPAQSIHNDFNMENILVDAAAPDKIAGIIDFGDMVHAPVLFDVAVGAAYQIGVAEDPVEAMCDFLRGYSAVSRLSEKELALLHTAVVMRLVMRLVIPQSRAQLFPDQAERLTIRSGDVWAQLARLDAVPRPEAIARLHQAHAEGMPQ